MNSKQAYSEAELVQALKQQDQHAYAHLYKNYSGSLLSIICQIIPERETAGDVLQELFVTIWKNIDKYDPSKGKLFTWLLRLAHNTAINKTRSKIFKSQQKNEDLGFFVDSIENKQSQQLQVNQIGLRKLVHTLREDYKNVIELAYFQGYTHEEISKTLDIPLGTVKTRLRNALIELRKRFV